MIWTKKQIQEQLEKNPRWLERGLVAIFRQQTPKERDVEMTLEHNERGFSAFDARLGSYLATWVMKGEKLSGRWVAKAKRLMKKYSGQLTRIANGELGRMAG